MRIDQPDSSILRFDWREHRRGCDKRGNNELQRFLLIVSGSASELDYHLLLARDLGCYQGAEYLGWRGI